MFVTVVGVVFDVLFKRVTKVFDAFLRAGGSVDANDGIRFKEIGIDDEVVVLLDRRVEAKMLLEEADQLWRGTIKGQIGSQKWGLDTEIGVAGEFFEQEVNELQAKSFSLLRFVHVEVEETEGLQLFTPVSGLIVEK